MLNMQTEPNISRYLHSKGIRMGLPVSGTFELTPRCNFDCKMCYVHLTAEEQRKRGPELSCDQWLSLASDARDAGMVFLLLTGGEPLVRPDFPKLLSELKKMGLFVSINSNGSMITKEMLDFFREDPPARFNITLYGGSNETYERLCGRPAFDAVVGNIRALLEIGIPVKLNCSLTPYNGADLDQIAATAEALQVPLQTATYMFPPIRRDETMIGCGDRFTSEEAAENALHWDQIRFTEEQFAARAERMAMGLSTPEGDSDCEGAPGEGIRCRAGRASFWINWQGMMTPCGMMTEPAFCVLEDGFAAAWEKTKAAAAAIRLPSACASCKYKHACHACAAMCMSETGRFDGRPCYVCTMTQKHVELTLKAAKK